MSPCASSPRLGMLPSGLEKDNVSVVRFSSSTFSLGGVGGGGLTGLGKVVPVGGPLFGRNMRLKPVPAKVPVKLDSTPSGGAGVVKEVEVGDFKFSSLPSCEWILNSDGRFMVAIDELLSEASAGRTI